MTHLGRLASPGGGGVAMEVGAEGAEEAHGVHGPAANLCVRSGGHPIRGSGQEPLGDVTGHFQKKSKINTDKLFSFPPLSPTPILIS